VSFKDSLLDLATDKTRGFLPGALKPLLFLLSLVYGLAVVILIFAARARQRRLACRVISVGNITLGGTGKTVMVELIANYLKANGCKVAILSRGYKRPSAVSGKGLVGYETMGDEPFMMSLKLKDVPVLVDPDRLRSARRAISEYGADTLILDDGFQQWRLNKDLEIVMIDAAKPFGNRRLMPRGVLRQPLFTLKSADIFVLTNTQAVDLNKVRGSLSQINPRALILEAEHAARGVFRLSRKDELLSVDLLKGRPVSFFCGLGNPGSFRSLCLRSGLKEGLNFQFPDHYRYEEEDLEKMIRACGERNIEYLLTTEKDAVRIPLAARKRFGEKIFVLAIELKIKNEEQGFYNRLRHIHPA
jgi:tetraacyldisaccharide 4'-kinase